MRMVANKPDPAILRLPWNLPLEEWGDEFVIPLPRGLSRHIVRIVRLGDRVYAVKETQEPIAFREYSTLRDLQRLGMPAVIPQGVVTDRTNENGEPLPAVLITEHLKFSLSYRNLFAHGMSVERLPALIDAIVVLLVRLHLSGFYWGDVSLSNVLFRRAAGEFAAYLVDAETGEFKPQVSAQLRDYDLTVGCENIYAELLDLQALGAVDAERDPLAFVERLRERYDQLWAELTDLEQFSPDEFWRLDDRLERLNELGFDVEEIDIVTDFDGDQVQIQPKVVELGHHQRELSSLTGMWVEDNQARRLLNDIAAYTATKDLGREDKHLVATRWMNDIFEPIMALVPHEHREKLDEAELFHEILVHRWYLSEKAGHEIDIFDVARDYFAWILPPKPDESVSTADELKTLAEMEELATTLTDLEPVDDQD